MNLKTYEATLLKPLRQATLVLLLKEGQILLAMKKRGFGVGRWNGVGGKPEPGETIEEAAIRETQEEIGVTPLDLRKVGVIDFFFPLVPAEKDFNQQVTVFTATRWKGEPVETEEMKPQWFDPFSIPYPSMWADDIYWLPKVLQGFLVNAKFLFGENDKVLDYQVQELKVERALGKTQTSELLSPDFHIATLKDAQRLVKAFAERNGWKDAPNVDKFDHLHEELIEMSQHLRYKTEEERAKTIAEQKAVFADGIGDLFFGLCRLANQLGVDLEEAFHLAKTEILGKYDHQNAENKLIRN